MKRTLWMLVLAAPLAAAQERTGPAVSTADRAFPVKEVELRQEGADLVVEYVEPSGAKGKLNGMDVVEISIAPLAPARAAGSDDVQVVLRTGDVLVGSVEEGGKDSLVLASESLGRVNVDFGHIEQVAFLSQKPSWQKTPPPGMKNDVILTASGDRPSGTLRSISKGKLVYFNERRKRDVELKNSDLNQIWFMAVGPKPPSPPSTLYALLALTDGGAVQGTVKRYSGGALVFTDLYGAERKVPAGGLSAIYFKNGRVMYLSDLDPAKVDENANYIRGSEPQLSDLNYPWQRDANAGDAGKLSIRGREFRKGLGVHARSELTFALGGAFSRFQATVGIDDYALRLSGLDQAGNVSFIVSADGKVLEKKSGVTSKTAPIALDIDVKGRQELTLTVDFGEDRSGQCDFADWALARLIR